MPLPIAEFMVKFQELKRAVNSNPGSIGWMSKQREKVADLVYELCTIDTQIDRRFSIQSEKFSTHIDPKFVPAYREYLDRYHEQVLNAAAPIIEARRNEFFESLSEIFQNADDAKVQTVLASYGIDVDAPEELDLSGDDPAQCFFDMLDYVPDWLDTYDEETAGRLNKGLGAWSYFQSTVGIGLREILNRWTAIPHTLIPRHVSAHHGLEIGSLNKLLAEAHRSYVFGCNGAAMALCRTILDMVLSKHYGIKGKDLKDIITTAEIRYRHLVGGMDLQKHRKTLLIA